VSRLARGVNVEFCWTPALRAKIVQALGACDDP
jgi:hypothetical protein